MNKRFIIVTHTWFINSESWSVDEFEGTRKEARLKKQEIENKKDKDWNLNHVESYIIEIKSGERLSKEAYASHTTDKTTRMSYFIQAYVLSVIILFALLSIFL